MASHIDKDKLIKALKELNYVSTKSGPVEPSRTKVIKAMTQQTLAPVDKPQDAVFVRAFRRLGCNRAGRVAFGRGERQHEEIAVV